MADLGSDSDSGPEHPPGFEPTTGRSTPAHGGGFLLPDLPPHLVLGALVQMGLPRQDVRLLEASLRGVPMVEPLLLTLMQWLLVARALPDLTPRPPALLPPDAWLAIVACAGLVAHSLVSRSGPPAHRIARHMANTTSRIARQLADKRVAAAEARAAAAEARAAAAEARAAAAVAATAAAEARTARAAADAAAAQCWAQTLREKWASESHRAISLLGALEFHATLPAQQGSGSGSGTGGSPP